VAFEGLQLSPDVRAALDSELIPDPATAPALLRRGVGRWSDAELVVHDGVVHTWRDVDQASADVARGLLAIGVTKGSRVGILAPNSVDWIVCFLAAARIGAVVSPLSTFMAGPELSRALAQADVQVLLCVDRFLGHDYLERLEQISELSTATGPALFLTSHPHLRHVVVWGDAAGVPAWAIPGPAGLAHAADAVGVTDELLRAAEDSVAPADWFLTVWTSGTTSEPKGVVHTHGGVLRYCHGLRAMGRADVREGEHSYSALPFFWLGGLNGQVIPALLCCAVMGEISANYDERQFPEPERFVLDREPNRHVSFGMGRHRCPGSHLARVEFAEMLDAVLRRMPDYEIVEDGLEEYPSWVGIGGWSEAPFTFAPGLRLR
jgi:acyl-coenzyme A synthetase/AMP-(fatty) acid ligase